MGIRALSSVAASLAIAVVVVAVPISAAGAKSVPHRVQIVYTTTTIAAPATTAPAATAPATTAPQVGPPTTRTGPVLARTGLQLPLLLASVVLIGLGGLGTFAGRRRRHAG